MLYKGGAFKGSEAQLFDLLRLGLDLGCEYVDMETTWSEKARSQVCDGCFLFWTSICLWLIRSLLVTRIGGIGHGLHCTLEIYDITGSCRSLHFSLATYVRYHRL